MKRISPNDTLWLKGIGILFIIFHNYFHLLQPVSGENEFSFDPQNFIHFLANISSDPINCFQYLFAYFGHYGVQLFIFCSGYGLTAVYSNKDIKYKDFIAKRLLKLYPAFTIALALLIAYQYLFLDTVITSRTLIALALRYSFIANLVPGNALSLCGPYWFYSMIVQLYLLFPLFLFIHKKSNYGLWIVILVSYIIILSANNYFSDLQLSLYYNFIGNVPVFALGIILASKKAWNFPIWLWALSIAVFLAGQYSATIWSFSQITFVLITVPVFLKLSEMKAMPLLKLRWMNAKNVSSSEVAGDDTGNREIPKGIISRFILFTGSISMYLFAVNGFMRQPWIGMSDDSVEKYHTYIYFATYMALVYLLALLVRKYEHSLNAWIRNRWQLPL
jgi:peptidoglycan/LPS O-acetylase OafA/YrhL